ncbi:hypothetical protein BCEN4_50023 [Burkholderia cenocepacia]|nr:hypothetical protein BCEN4_50023 [Burkholderia cenocepacia]
MLRLPGAGEFARCGVRSAGPCVNRPDASNLLFLPTDRPRKPRRSKRPGRIPVPTAG